MSKELSGTMKGKGYF